MRILIDCADIEKIKEMDNIYPLHGVTCNPTILKRANVSSLTELKTIKNYLGDRELHVQLIATESKAMVDEALYILDKLGKDVYIKVPVDKQGLIAIKLLKERKVNVTATAIYDPMQAYLAALVNADYVAPYVNRIEQISGNGIETACLISDILKKNRLLCQVIGASFKRIDQVLAMAQHGIDSVTLSYELLSTLLDNNYVDKAIKAFINDFEEIAGYKKTMLDL